MVERLQALGFALAVSVGCSRPKVGSLPPDPPSHFPAMAIPEDNPQSKQKVELGRYLFHDFRLSVNSERSCGICHEPAKAFTDGFSRAIGTTGEIHTRNTLSLINVGYREQLGWQNPEMRRLEDQWHVPMFGDDPVEMGLSASMLIERLSTIELYVNLFDLAFPEESMALNEANVGRALASFQRTIVGGDSPYDRWLLGDDSALNSSALQGMLHFERLGCERCHGGLFFDQPDASATGDFARHGYENTGLYNLDTDGGYPLSETGLHAETERPEDIGKFRIPGLRGVALSGPWSHDGTQLSLGDVIDAYARGGRLVHHPDYRGDGALNPNKSPLLTGFTITSEEKDQLVDFLSSLTDQQLIDRPDLQTPFCLMVDGEAINMPCESWEPIIDTAH